MSKGVVFDFNGTLVFDGPLHLIAWNRIFREITGHGVTEYELDTMYNGKPNLVILQMIAPGQDPAWYEAYSQKKEALYREELKNSGLGLVSGAYDMFAMLGRNRIPMTIATASIKENVDFFIENFHLDEYMDTDMIVLDDGSYTDKTAMYAEAGRRLGCGDDLLIFEDSFLGISGASKLPGARIIAIDNKSLRTYADRFPAIVKIVKDYTECMDTVREMCGCNL